MKPECEQALRDIERFLDGEMTEPERALIDVHLTGCTPCMERADLKRHVKELVASRCGCDEVPERLRAKIVALLQGPPGSTTGSPHDPSAGPSADAPLRPGPVAGPD